MNVQAKPGNLIKGASGDWEVVIGMEVHAQVTSHSKLFSGASTEFGGAPNSHVSLVDAAMPGMLPVINEECVKQAIRTGLGLQAKINLKSVFDRKNYFYPDLPQGYQISQYKSPVVGEGEVVVDLAEGDAVTVGIERLHLEQDAGKSLHDRSPTMSYVDLNRSGVALMEIVSKPDIRSSKQAMAFMAKLRAILRHLGTCDGNMEEGSLRADVNVSVRRAGEQLRFGTRCEIKNMNSISFIGDAIEYEARRQIEIIEAGGAIEQETRLYDPDEGVTRSMRSKEEAHDYRYFPDPDLLPLEVTQAYVDDLKANLPELPDVRRTRFTTELGLNMHNANMLVSEREIADYFEQTLEELRDKVANLGRQRVADEVSKWVLGELFGALNATGLKVTDSRISPQQLASIVRLKFDPEYGGTIAREAFLYTWEKGGDPRENVEALGLKQITNVGELEALADEVITKNPDKVRQAKVNPKALMWFVGQIMKSSGGKASPQAVQNLLKKKLGIESQEIPAENQKRAREILFEERVRTRQEPLRRGESLFAFYNECARDGYDQFRSIINSWLSEMDRTARAKLISRMRNAGNNAFEAALCELLVHTLLVRLEYRVVVEPKLPGTNARPDFAIIDEKGEAVCYVEVTTVNRADEVVDKSNREAVIYNAIDKAKLPVGCVLGYELIEAGPDGVDSPALIASIEQWAKENLAAARTNQIIQRFTAEGWIIELELFFDSATASATHSIGTAWLGGGVITPQKDLRKRLEKKSNWYGTLDVPFLVVAADAKGQIFGKEQVENSLTESVFGDEQVTYIGTESLRTFAKNGLWVGKEGVQNQHVSGVLLIPDTGIWKLRDKKRQPLLAINPWLKNPLPDSMKVLPHFEAVNDKWVLHDGKMVADILKLPETWPPIE